MDVVKPEPDFRDEIRRAIQDAAAFVGLTLSTPQSAAAGPAWQRVRVRPVQLQAQGRLLQVTCFGEKKSETKNYGSDAIAGVLAALLAQPYTHLHLQTTAGDLHVRITRKGKTLVSRTKARPGRRCPRPPRRTTMSKRNRFPRTARTRSCRHWGS